MTQEKKNKQFIIGYYNALAGKEKPEHMIRKYVADEKLIEHIKFFEKSFPEYDLIPEEIIAEGDRVFVRARIEGMHEGEMDGIPPTFQEIKMPFAICYRIGNGRIVDHWMIADQMELLEQLGLARTMKSEFD